MTACGQIGAVVEVTHCDARFLADNFDDQLEDMAALCLAVLRKREADRKQR